MMDIMTKEAASCDLKDLVGKFIPESIGKDIEKACQGIYPLQVRGTHTGSSRGVNRAEARSASMQQDER